MARYSTAEEIEMLKQVEKQDEVKIKEIIENIENYMCNEKLFQELKNNTEVKIKIRERES